MHDSHKPTMRVIGIVECVADFPQGITLTGISKELELPKSTLVPILKAMRDMDYLQFQEDTGMYTIGYKLFSIGTKFLDKFDIMEEIGKELQNLVNVYQETCYFGILEHGNVLYLQKKENMNSLGVLTGIGNTKPAYGTGLGKALLMDMKEKDLRELYPYGLEQLTEHTICDYGRLADELKQQKIAGYSWEAEESTKYIQCFAVPIRKEDKIIGAISMAIPVFRFKEEMKTSILESLMKSSRKIEVMIEETDVKFEKNVMGKDG